jgi:HPt (histidine-containing phosphotransfer) domain-containing protein
MHSISYDVGPALERFGGDRDFLAECVGLLKAEIPALLAALKDGIRNNAPDPTHAAAHALKGMTSNFCEEGPAMTAAALVEAAREGHMSDAPALLARLEQEIDALVLSLEAATAH